MPTLALSPCLPLPNTLPRCCRLLPWNPRYQIIALCFLATLTAYVERTGFSIAYTGMAKTAGLSESVKGTVLSAFYWGYALSQVNPEGRKGGRGHGTHSPAGPGSGGGTGDTQMGLIGTVNPVWRTSCKGTCAYHAHCACETPVPCASLHPPLPLPPSQIPGGMAAQRYGGDIMLSISFALWATASLLTPGTAESVRAIVLARMCVGVAQGFLIPAVHTGAFGRGTFHGGASCNPFRPAPLPRRPQSARRVVTHKIVI